MENKIKLMEKAILGLILAAVLVQGWLMYGLFSLQTLIILLAPAAVLIINRKKVEDERELQLRCLAGYGAVFIMLAFLLVFQAVEYAKSLPPNPLAGNIINLLLLSYCVLLIVLRGSLKSWKS